MLGRQAYCFIVFAIAAYVSAPSAADARTHRVPTDYGTIQAGIDAASEGDTVLVAPGTYTGEGNKELDFKGVDRVLRSEGGAEVTIIDCEGEGKGASFVGGETAASVMSGFTIRNGLSAESGGIYCVSSSPTITKCTISGNAASDYEAGGGIYCDSSSSSIQNCVVIDNSGGSSGGGIACFGSSSTAISDCTISGNSATFGGGGIYCSLADSALTITNCTISGNSGGSFGGGICCASADSSLTISNCTITGNSAVGGGGIFCIGSPAISDCTISQNTAWFLGGGIGCLNEVGSPTVTNCVITGNSSASAGGGIWCAGTSVVTGCTISDNWAGYSGGGGIACAGFSAITNCTITGNSTDVGGGGVFATAFSTITNCTISGNSAEVGGGGVSYIGSPTITNCILWGDAPDEVYIESSGDPTFSHCDVQGGYGGEGNIDADPLFADAASGDYHLTDGSPCVDTGTADGAPDTDFEGDARPQGDGYDMGADEFGGGGAACDLEVVLSDYPSSVQRDGTLSFRAEATNGCDDPLTFDRAVMNITGPASLDKTLYDGDPFTVVGSVGTDLSLGVPSRAPLGTYTVEVTIFRDGETIDAASFEVEVSG